MEMFEPLWISISLSLGGILVLIAVIGNMMTILAIYKYRWLRTKSNILLFSLAVCDILAAVFWFLYEIFNFVFKMCQRHKDTHIWMRLTTNVFFECSLFHLFTISVERYIAIIHCLRYKQIVTTITLCIMIIPTWLTPLFITYLMFPWIQRNTPDHSCITSNIWNKINVYVNSSLFGVGALIISFIYFRIYQSARSQRRNINQTIVGPPETRRKHGTKATKTLTILLSAYLISWSPYFVIEGTKFFYPTMDNDIYVWVFNIFLKVGLANSAVNFLVYAYSNRNFRKAYKLLLTTG